MQENVSEIIVSEGDYYHTQIYTATHANLT
jgi:hypothetical protein